MLYATVRVLPDSPIALTLSGAVRVGDIGCDLWISGEPADLLRLAAALTEAAGGAS